MPARLTTAGLIVSMLGLAACENAPGATGTMEGTGPAQRACRTALNQREVVGPNDNPATVTGAQYGEPTSTVELLGTTGARWTCVATNDGSVVSLGFD